MGGGETVNLLVEGNARVGWAVGDVNAEVQSALKEIVEEEINASSGGLAGADVHFQEGLNDALVVNEEMNDRGVDHVIVGAQPGECAFEGRYFCVEGGGREDPFHMFCHNPSGPGDQNGLGSEALFFPEAPVGIDHPSALCFRPRDPLGEALEPRFEIV